MDEAAARPPKRRRKQEKPPTFGVRLNVATGDTKIAKVYTSLRAIFEKQDMLQCAKTECRGVWTPPAPYVVVVENKGKVINSFGVMKGPHRVLELEEALYLMERGTLSVEDKEKRIWSIRDMYSYLPIPLYAYFIYGRLRRAGFDLCRPHARSSFPALSQPVVAQIAAAYGPRIAGAGGDVAQIQTKTRGSSSHQRASSSTSPPLADTSSPDASAAGADDVATDATQTPSPNVDNHTDPTPECPSSSSSSQAPPPAAEDTSRGPVMDPSATKQQQPQRSDLLHDLVRVSLTTTACAGWPGTRGADDPGRPSVSMGGSAMGEGKRSSSADGADATATATATAHADGAEGNGDEDEDVYCWDVRNSAQRGMHDVHVVDVNARVDGAVLDAWAEANSVISVVEGAEVGHFVIEPYTRPSKKL